ncbi:MAG TPA: bifunctional phosphoribosylaminoimidazolecarboxamide formyltransferase/IMP cyclohydrolase [Vicinamibacterales bacterium]|nr:bifunctional phosphoribosylaminoimidazolecarboxamide formyltransferase/IMP cyclohydrolase [Vicinamibacterales bacterium]
MRRAILSVSDKTGLVAFGKALADRGFELVSTGGTAKALADAGLAVVNVSDVTGFPEMMDGRVKTLHPKIHGGILARRHHREDLQLAAEHGIGLVDLVVVNLYPFVETAAKPGIAFDDLIEQIDIGGPSLVRAASKNFKDVLIVVSPGDYDEVIAELDRPGGPSTVFRFELARRAFKHTGQYDTAIASILSEVQVDGSEFELPGPKLQVSNPDTLLIRASKLRDLRYGENPHQPAGWYALQPPAGLGAPAVLQGKELSFTNLLDLDAAARIVLEFDEPAAAVIKHTNPCGVATGATIADAYVRAREADSLAAFGGIIGLNRKLDESTAREIVSTFIECVIAPDVEDTARTILAAKQNLRVIVADFRQLTDTREYRSILGAMLVQERDRVAEAQLPWPTDGVRVVTKRQPTPEEWQGLRFAWRVMAHVKSNTVIFTDAVRTLAIGAGQMSRVDAVNVAVNKAAGWKGAAAAILKGSVAASDAFFPFRDGLDAVAAAGATAVVQPGGSVKDPEVIAAADEHGLAMVFTGRRHFRH